MSDAAGNAATTVTRTVNVIDTTPPVITLTGSTPLDHEVNTTYTDAGATYSDNLDGTGSVSAVGTVDDNTL